MHPQVHRLQVEGDEHVALDWYPAAHPNTRSPLRAALFVPGLGSHRRGEKSSYFARRFNEGGLAFAALDLRGQGDSDGRPRDLTLTRMLADVATAMRFLRDPLRCNTPLLLIGTSMGAAVAAWHAAREPASIAGLVLIAPALRFPAALTGSLAAQSLERWRAGGVHRVTSPWIDLELGYALVEDAARYQSETLALALATPTLLIHGMRDQQIPWSQSTAFAAELPRGLADVLLIGAGDHRLTEHKVLLFEALWAWLDQRPQ
jgi:alpha-beta hydrolase superfamily lysophospholipase